MLRRKFMLGLGSMVMVLVVLAIGAIWILHGILTDLYHVNTHAVVMADQVGRLSIAITSTEANLYELQIGRTRHLDTLIESINDADAAIDQLGGFYFVQIPGSEATQRHQRIRRLYKTFKNDVRDVVSVQDSSMALRQYENLLATSINIRNEVMALNRVVENHLAQEQQAVTEKFRWSILGFAITALMVINLAVVVLLRMSGIVLRPVDKLVAASRELGRENFDHRVSIDQHDEFDELAHSLNSMAEQLKSNEQRRIEVLEQVARTLNHELNNAMSIIELQLQLVRRHARAGDCLENHLQQIREGLARMSRTVSALKHVRRIVLTDYLAGEKMLDIERSIEADDPPSIETTGQARRALGAPREVPQG